MLFQYLSSPNKEGNNGEGIRHVEEDGASSNIRSKSNARSEIQKTKGNIEEVGKQDGSNGNVQTGLDSGEEVVEDDALVSSHGVEESACTCGAGGAAIDEANSEHEGQDGRGCAAFGCLEDHFDDREAGGSGENRVGVNQAEEHDEDKGASTVKFMLEEYV